MKNHGFYRTNTPAYQGPRTSPFETTDVSEDLVAPERRVIGVTGVRVACDRWECTGVTERPPNLQNKKHFVVSFELTVVCLDLRIWDTRNCRIQRVGGCMGSAKRR